MSFKLQFLIIVISGINLLLTVAGGIFVYGRLTEKVASHGKAIDRHDGRLDRHEGEIGELYGRLRMERK